MTGRPLRTRRGGESGAITLIASISMTTILGMAALVADMGSLHLAKRRLQAATDSAALSATYPVAEGTAASPLSVAQSYLAKNISGANVTSAVSGTYCPDSAASVTGRFIAGQATCANETDITAMNAVKVTASTVSPLYFGRVLTGGGTSETLTATATAAQINEAGFYAGTGTASLNAGLVNAILMSVLPGSNINLSLAQYNGLLGANIDALTFMNALATDVGISAGTYNSVLTSTATVQQVIQAEIDALNAPGSVASVALNTLKADIVGSPRLTLSSLLDVGVWKDVGIGSVTAPGALSATLNAFQLASLTAQVANGTSAVSIPAAALGIPGIATVSSAASVIQPPQGPAFTFSPVGVTVHTAQVRLQLNLQLLSALSVLNGLNLVSAPVSLPIYIEVAPGNAQLTGISCGFNPATDATVQIQASSGLAHAYVGTVSNTVMSNVSSPVTVSPATLVNVLNVITVTGQGSVSVGGNNATTLTFNQTGITNLTPQTVGSTSLGTSLISSLGNSTVLSGSLLGISLAPASPTLKTVTGLLTPVFQALDPIVDNLLAGLGIQVGTIAVTATGVRCGAPTLVN
jgi:uncharacterized membrane protein